MPLIKNKLKEKISIFADQLHPLFEGIPQSINDNAEKWAEAIDTYASSVIPQSTNNVLAKQAFIKVMKDLSEPVIEDKDALPFTIYYKSPETRMYRFNKYLRDEAKYKSNPSLDKTEVFTRLNKIRSEYNKLYPIIALTEDDIRYNQARFNQIYATEIAEGKIISLQDDGVTTRSANRKYLYIPVDKNGQIIKLQEDGIIGDDTIRYLPIIEFTVYEENESIKWNRTYANIKFITQPSTSGEVFINIPFKDTNGDWNVQNRTSNTLFKTEIIDKGLSKDFTKIQIEKTQSQIDGGLFSSVSLMSTFISEFEKNHATCDLFWIKNRIATMDQLIAFKKLAFQTYKATPKNKKDGVMSLENAIIAYATSLAIGMNPLFTASPRTIPIDLSPVAVKGLAGASNSSCISTIVDLIDAYFKGGTATNNSSGLTTTWQ